MGLIKKLTEKVIKTPKPVADDKNKKPKKPVIKRVWNGL